MNWLKNWDETEGKAQLEHYANAMSCLSMIDTQKKERLLDLTSRNSDVGQVAPESW
jgi:hypothetical protein